jgi:stearoyl-CoA desaturase (Delta-9 desaturase)
MSATLLDSSAPPGGAKPMLEGRRPTRDLVILWAFVSLPFAALIVAVPVAWGGFLSWTDVILAVSFYVVSGLGISIGFHRHFTHGSFKARPPLRTALAVAGSLAIQGGLVQWVADHRRHHAYSDVEGDPHSPWRYGENVRGLTKGLLFAHIGWLFRREVSNRERFAPDLLADRALRRADSLFWLWVTISMVAPAVIGGLVTWSLAGALTAFFWASLVRVSLLHHVTWSVNSVCHVFGDRPFAVREGDRAANFWPLALISFGESWHNLHHSDPTSARHGALRGQIDIAARTIWLLEKAGLAYDVRWPKPERLAAKMITTSS